MFLVVKNTIIYIAAIWFLVLFLLYGPDNEVRFGVGVLLLIILLQIILSLINTFSPKTIEVKWLSNINVFNNNFAPRTYTEKNSGQKFVHRYLKKIISTEIAISSPLRYRIEIARFEERAIISFPINQAVWEDLSKTLNLVKLPDFSQQDLSSEVLSDPILKEYSKKFGWQVHSFCELVAELVGYDQDVVLIPENLEMYALSGLKTESFRLFWYQQSKLNLYYANTHTLP